MTDSEVFVHQHNRGPSRTACQAVRRREAAVFPAGRRRPTRGPTCPTQRANSFPKVTNLFCRLPLPTLFHRLEAANLGDLMRLWVRSGKGSLTLADAHGARRLLTWIFTGYRERSRHVESNVLYQQAALLHRSRRLTSPAVVKERRKLHLRLSLASPSSLGRRVAS